MYLNQSINSFEWNNYLMSHSYRVLVLETLSVLLSITVNHDGIINGETAGPQQSSEEIAIQAIRGVIRPAEEAEATTTGSPTARSRSGSSLCCRTDCGLPHGLRNVTVKITPLDPLPLSSSSTPQVSLLHSTSAAAALPSPMVSLFQPS